MSNWTVKKRIVCGFTSILLLLGVLAVSSIVLLHKIENNINVILVDSMPGVTIAGQIKCNTINGHLAVWRHFIAKTPEDKRGQEETITNTSALNDKLMADYEKTITTEEDRQIFEKLKQTRADYGNARQKMLEMSLAAHWRMRSNSTGSRSIPPTRRLARPLTLSSPITRTVAKSTARPAGPH